MEENKTATKAIRTYKDTVFRMIFKEKKELLSLFNAINGTKRNAIVRFVYDRYRGSKLRISGSPIKYK